MTPTAMASRGLPTVVDDGDHCCRPPRTDGSAQAATSHDVAGSYAATLTRGDAARRRQRATNGDGSLAATLRCDGSEIEWRRTAGGDGSGRRRRPRRGVRIVQAYPHPPNTRAHRYIPSRRQHARRILLQRCGSDECLRSRWRLRRRRPRGGAAATYDTQRWIGRRRCIDGWRRIERRRCNDGRRRIDERRRGAATGRAIGAGRRGSGRRRGAIISHSTSLRHPYSRAHPTSPPEYNPNVAFSSRGVARLGPMRGVSLCRSMCS